MKTTVQEVNRMRNSIFVQWELKGDFQLLLDERGDTFETLGMAIEFIRTHHSDQLVGLATFGQALLKNAEWDNL